ncbi:hypothetical protein HDU98_010746 [Podochytrium sp. JEL0797]|nr:hypothetical protein HDU98_010746 [Podochytrium sp. JEL0797]
MSAQPSVTPGSQCQNQPTFNQCIGNYQSGGGVNSCHGLPQNGSVMNECLCKNYFTEAYCYNTFCPQDSSVSLLNNLQAQYCGLVPTFNPNPTGSPLPTAAAAPGNSAQGTATSTAQPSLVLPNANSHAVPLSGTPNVALLVVFACVIAMMV